MGKLVIGDKNQLGTSKRYSRNMLKESPTSISPYQSMNLSETIIEKIIYIDRPVEVIKEIQVIKEHKIEIPKEVVVYIDRPVEVIKEIEKVIHIDKIIFKDKIVEIIKNVEIPKIIIKKQVPQWIWLMIGAESLALILALIH